MKYKEAILAGVGGGLMFGVIQSFTVGPAAGLFMGLFFGVAFGVMTHLFANSKLVKTQTTVPEAILLPGEHVLVSKLANLVIRPKDFGLDNFMFDGLFWLVGMKNKESLGGALHVTNYRIIFKSHLYNRLRGMTSIFLPTIEQLENRTKLFIFRKLAVATGTAQVEFVIGEVDNVIAQINEARTQLDEQMIAELQNHVRTYPEKCSDELEPWTAFNRINTLFNIGRKATGASQVVTNPMGLLSSMLIDELMDKTVSEKWQTVFEGKQQGPTEQKRSAA